jgi:hypothetical protein
MNYILTLFISLFVINVFGQPAIRSLNKNGKRQGKWPVYLDNKWRSVKDTVNPTFIAYDKYVNGRSYCALIGKYKMPFRYETTASGKLLNGEYKWYDKKNRLKAVYVFENGETVTIDQYRKNGELEFHFDFKIIYDNNPYTYGMYWYYPKTGESVFFIRKDSLSSTVYKWDIADPKLKFNK